MDSYIVVFDTIVEYLPENYMPGNKRPWWGPENSPYTAVKTFLKANSDFSIDKSLNNKLMISVAPDGYLKKQI